MDPKKLPQSVLIALGLTAAAHSGGCIGPCLDVAVETDTDPDSDSDSDSDTQPTDTGPCLDFDTEAESASASPLLPLSTPLDDDAQDPEGRVLERGVLPDDVAALIRKRRADPA